MHPQLQLDFEGLTNGFSGRVGVCTLYTGGVTCVRGDERFSLQSVMKLVTCLAVMDAVDRHILHLDDPVLVRRQDLSLNVQPLIKLVGQHGFQTTLGDLVRRAIVDSDSAAADVLVSRMGGPKQIQTFLERRGITGIRVDRDERHLQTEIVGLTWRPEYVDPVVLDRAEKTISKQQRDTAYRRYQIDPRDTATPRGMAELLQRLATGQLLTPESTRFVLNVMSQTVTFPNRLKAGVPPGWTMMHKTGTSGSWHGVTAATNDVGIMRAPDGNFISIAVFIGDSSATSQARAALMAKLAAATAKDDH